jgi:pimeloyl-ACP methyl ester carboxylesterase
MRAGEFNNEQYSLEFTGVNRLLTIDGVEKLILKTSDGQMEARFHQTPVEDAAVLWVGGAGGGLDGPAGGMYPRLATQLARQHIASLRLHYRYPNELLSCVMDTLLGIEYLRLRNYARVILIGHSFGGAVVICAGALSKQIMGVVAMSSQTYGTDLVEEISPRPLLLLHGTADEILPDACSHDIYRRALEPKEMLLYPGCRHGLDECHTRVDQDLLNWIQQVLHKTE